MTVTESSNVYLVDTRPSGAREQMPHLNGTRAKGLEVVQGECHEGFSGHPDVPALSELQADEVQGTSELSTIVKGRLYYATWGWVASGPPEVAFGSVCPCMVEQGGYPCG